MYRMWSYLVILCWDFQIMFLLTKYKIWIIKDLHSIILLPCHFCLSTPFLHWTKPWPILFNLPQWLNRISHLKFGVVFELSIKSIGISANYPRPVGFTGNIKAAGKILSLSPISSPARLVGAFPPAPGQAMSSPVVLSVWTCSVSNPHCWLFCFLLFSLCHPSNESHN